MKLKKCLQKIQGQSKKSELMFWIGKVGGGLKLEPFYRGYVGEAQMSVKIWNIKLVIILCHVAKLTFVQDRKNISKYRLCITVQFLFK